MLTTIIKAAQNFCLHQIHEDCVEQKEVSDASMFITSIDIQTSQHKTYRVYFGVNQRLIQKLAQLFLEEDESNEETLQDIALETTNLIIGSAKVIAQEEKSLSYTIQTPYFEKIGIFDFKYDKEQVFSIDTNEIILAIKELDA